MLSSFTKRPRIIIQNSTSQCSSAELISTNQDLLTEIFLRLPIKSLLNFKSVSKYWLSLITNPHFSQKRYPIFASPSGLFMLCTSPHAKLQYEYIPLDNNPPRPPFRSLTFVHHRSGIKVCNDLLLCLSSPNYVSKRKYYIFNPTTKHFTLLPRLSAIRGTSRSVLGLYLAHDQSTSPTYKAICVRNCDSLDNHYQIEVYSSETGPWRLSGASFAADISQFKNGVFWNGSIHWICEFGPSLYFDIEPPPDDDTEEKTIMYFGESRDHLHLIETYGPPTSTKFNVYEMSRDYSGWTVKYRVDLDSVALGFPEMVSSDQGPWTYRFSVLSLVGEEAEEESNLVVYIPDMAIRYNFKDKTFKKIWDFTVGADCESLDTEFLLQFGWWNCFQYFESLSVV